MSLSLIFLRSASDVIEIMIIADIFESGFSAAPMGAGFLRTVTDPGQPGLLSDTHTGSGIVCRDKERTNE